MSDRWPNEDQRRERRTKLIERLTAFLDAGYIEMSDGDGFADVPTDDLSEMRKIFVEIAALKASPDCDGDASVEIAIGSRRRGRLIYATIPHEPRFYEDNGRGRMERRDLTPREELDYAYDLMRSYTYLTATVHSLASQIESQIGQTKSIFDAEDRHQATVEDIRAGLEARDDFKLMSQAISGLQGEEQNAFYNLYRETYADIFGEVEQGFLDRINAAIGETRDKDNLVAFEEIRKDLLEAVSQYGHYGLMRAIGLFNRIVRHRRALALEAGQDPDRTDDPKFQRLAYWDLTRDFRKSK